MSRNLEIPIGKTVYVHKPPASSDRGKVTRFLRNYDGPYLVIGHSHNRPNLLRLEHQFTKEILPVINIEKVVVADAPDTLHIPHTAVIHSEEECTNTPQRVPQSELATVAFHFGEYLVQCSHQCSMFTVLSEACKFVYKKYPPARDILSHHGRLRGLVASCPYLFLSGGAQGGTYNITVGSDLFLQLSNR